MVTLIFLGLAVSQIQVAISQCLNRPPNIVFNRPEFIEAPNALSLQPIIETPLLPPPLIPPPTTIITDCTPEVCKNLANTLQLMIVCNLLKNTKGGSDLAVQLASPIIGEFLSSPAFSCPCSEKRVLNSVSPNLIAPGISTIPGLIGSISPGFGLGPVYLNSGVGVNNPFLGNILGIYS